MNHMDRNWYIEYDYKIFHILNDSNYSALIFKLAELFLTVEGPRADEEGEEKSAPKEILEIAEAITEISTLLYNFFNVEDKLAKNNFVKSKYVAICSVLNIERQYTRYFFTMSQEFRINRILACILRLNKFMETIFSILSDIRKHLDQTLLDNLDEVYLFMQQRLRETLEVTRGMGDHDLNIILLDMLCLLLRNTGDPTMKKILDNRKQKQIIENILKSNEIYQDFMLQKLDERKKFSENKYFEIQMAVEQDPNLKHTSSHDGYESD